MKQRCNVAFYCRVSRDYEADKERETWIVPYVESVEARERRELLRKLGDVQVRYEVHAV